ncbi:MAG: C10 family peptidase [Bacteroidales bacterium]|nr:C10 family peptidase [Bacteroidales bacterium]
MRNKIIATLTLGLVMATTAVAKPRTQTQILDAARKVLHIEQSALNAGTLRHRAQGVETMKVLSQDEQLTVVGYEGGGYAIVTNDDLLPEIVGYSATKLDGEFENENFRWWWNMMHESAKQIVRRGVPAKAVRPNTNKYPAQVPQLMSTVWGQMEPYNSMCPLEYDRNGNVVGRTLVGCVATACTQIMNYLQYPTQGTGKYTDVQTTDAWGKPVPLTVDFADYTFDYSKMQDTYTPGSYKAEEAHEVAELSYACGVSFAMIYGTGASGTYLDSAAVSLKKHLGFPNIKYYSRGSYLEDKWMDIIFDELSHNRPVAYGGADDIFTIGGGGHCFVFDGYDANGLVHVNWGWYGRNDGYYDVNLLNPRIHSFKNQQDMVIGFGVPEAATGDKASLTLTGVLNPSDLDDLVEKSKSEGLRHVDLSAAELPDGILPAQAFYGSRLASIILPANTLSIGDGAFGYCSNLTQVTFPAASDGQSFIVEDNVIYTKDGKEVIEVLPYYYNKKGVMDDFTSLLTFRDGITAIHSYAMDGCFRIRGVEIPATVQKFGKRIFAHASSIKQVRMMSAVPAAALAGAFDALDAGYTRLVIPAGSWDMYSRAGEWRHFFALDNVVEKGTNIKARNVVRKVGEKNPELRYQMFGDYVMGEPVLTCEADENSPAGEYPIVVEKGTITAADVVLTNGVMRVVGDEEADGIVAVEQAEQQSSVYTLDGRKVNAARAQRGVYITKGKKVMK